MWVNTMLKLKSFLKKNKYSLLTILLFSVFCIPHDNLHAKKNKSFTAFVDSRSGIVKLYSSSLGKWYNAYKFAPIEQGDIVKTGFRSKCRIIFKDGTALDIEQRSRLDFDELNIAKNDEGKKVQSFKLKLAIGSLISTFRRATSRKSKMQIHTPVATISIRGTDLAVSVSGDEEDNATTVGLFEGEVSISSSDEESDPVILKPDQEAFIEKGSKPEARNYLSSLMKKKKVRAKKLRAYAEKLRKKLDERDEYFDDKINKRSKLLDERKNKLREKMNKPVETDCIDP